MKWADALPSSLRASASMAALLLAAVVIAACTSGTADELSGASGSTAPVSTTTSTAPPTILALAPSLGLAPQQCFSDLVLAEDDQSTTTSSLSEPTDETEPTAPPLSETTSVPRPATVAVVECAGTNNGQVYATFCLGTFQADEGEGAAVGRAVDQLTSVACPGNPDLDYPGDRSIRRAAARICLQRFEEQFQEEYASSDRVAQEFTPTEGLWDLGDHRVVCHSHLEQ